MAAHDLHHLRGIGRTPRRLRHFKKILRTDCSGCNDAQDFHVLGAVVVEPVNGAPRNAKRLSRPNVDQLAVLEVWIVTET